MRSNADIHYGMKKIVLFLLLSGCIAAQDRAQPKLPAKDLVLTSKAGQITINAELARSESEKTAGLMFRKKLADGEGMLFIWDSDRILSFWMKNTKIPLSIAYIDREGIIREIHDLRPGQLNSVQSSISLRYALEVPQGWFERAGLALGDKIDLTGVNK
ncbi:MAG: DUF192 domain-containing protein [Spirochaetaceae bacterium]|jgi:uncharacterized membrane protein (UPF0127 family)|nr:DUF192 domain-containing protein [Spirochaetaceae bacterium]